MVIKNLPAKGTVDGSVFFPRLGRDMSLSEQTGINLSFACVSHSPCQYLGITPNEVINAELWMVFMGWINSP